MMSTIKSDAARLSLLRSKILADFSNLDELSRIVESALVLEQKELKERVNAEVESVSEEEEEYLVGWYKLDFLQIEEVFPRIQRYALFVTVMSSTEANLVAVCVAMKEVLGISSKFRKKKGTDIFQNILAYLENECDIDVSKALRQFENVDKLRRIRNCIVHSDEG